MQRIATATKANDLFGAGKHGFKDRNLGAGIVPTDLNAEFFNSVQEEILSPIEAVGIAPSAVTRNQLLTAMRILGGSNVTTVNFAASPFTVTAAQGGLVLVDATAGNVVINLPLANVLNGLKLEFLRVDNTANTVTINRAGANTIDGATSFGLALSKSGRTIRSDGVSTWYASLNISASLSANGWQRLPSGLILQWGTAVVPASGLSTSSVAVVFPVSFTAAPFSFSGCGLGAANSVSGGRPAFYVLSSSTSGATFGLDVFGFTTFNQTPSLAWMAIGT